MESTDLIYKKYSEQGFKEEIKIQLGQRFKAQRLNRLFFSKNYVIGDLNLKIHYSNEKLVDFFHPARLFSAHNNNIKSSNFIVYVIEDECFSDPNYCKSFNTLYKENEEAIGTIVGISNIFRMNEKVGSIRYLDHKTSEFYYLIGDLKKVPKWEKWFPFRNLLNHIFLPSANQLIHAASVVHKNKGIILAGKSGSGKSTTTFSSVMNGLQSVGDDLILVNVDQKKMYCASNMFKLCNDIFSYYSNLDSAFHLAADFFEYNQKYHINMQLLLKEAITPVANINAIVLPIVTGKSQPSIAEISPREALNALVPSTLLLLQGRHSKSAIRKIRQLVEGLPCYQLHLSKDLKRNATFIKHFLENNFNSNSI